jgi:hypothetical protein
LVISADGARTIPLMPGKPIDATSEARNEIMGHYMTPLMSGGMRSGMMSLMPGEEPAVAYWSKDGRYLYLLDQTPQHFAAWVWQEGETEARPINVPAGFEVTRIETFREVELLLWGPGGAYRLSASGLRLVSNLGLCFISELGTNYGPGQNLFADLPDHRQAVLVGFDDQGRAILQSVRARQGEPDSLAALDLTTNKVTRIYP